MLWKQDVDLGYSLTPYVPEETVKTDANQTEDDTEKLKALEDLKDEKVMLTVSGLIRR